MSDLIKREDAIRQMSLMLEDISEDLSEQIIQRFGYDTAEQLATEAMSIIPTADRPQGEWIDEADKYDASFGIHDYRCSNCNSYADEYIGGHEWYTAGKPNFCPHCGAKMKGADDES